MAAMKANCISKEATVAEASLCSEQLDVSIVIPETSNEKVKDESRDNYQQRGQWLRAAVLGANDGLVSISSLMMGVGAVKSDAKAMVVSGLAALVAGACSMAIGEFVSVYTQRDVEVGAKKLKALKISRELLPQISSNSPSSLSTTVFTAPSRPASTPVPEVIFSKDDEEDESLPNPFQAACASALAFCVGGVVPLLSAAFIADYVIRVVVMGGASSVALVLFGAVGAYYGRASMVKGSLRVLIGGWIAMLVTYGLLKLFGTL